MKDKPTISYIANETELKGFRDGTTRQVWISIGEALTECEWIERLPLSGWSIVHNHGITMHIRKNISCPYTARDVLVVPEPIQWSEHWKVWVFKHDMIAAIHSEPSLLGGPLVGLCPANLSRIRCTIIRIEAKTLGEMTLKDAQASVYPDEFDSGLWCWVLEVKLCPSR